MFRQYTDRTYSQQIPGPAWLGFLGPVLRAEVGDVILVHLKNFASRNYSIHPHGVFYEKDAEGKKLQNGNSAHRFSQISVRKLLHCLPGGEGCILWKGRKLKGHVVIRSHGVFTASSLTFLMIHFLIKNCGFPLFFMCLLRGSSLNPGGIISTTQPALFTGFLMCDENPSPNLTKTETKPHPLSC